MSGDLAQDVLAQLAVPAWAFEGFGGLGFVGFQSRAWGLGFRVYGFRVQGFRVQGFRDLVA